MQVFLIKFVAKSVLYKIYYKKIGNNFTTNFVSISYKKIQNKIDRKYECFLVICDVLTSSYLNICIQNHMDISLITFFLVWQNNFFNRRYKVRVYLGFALDHIFKHGFVNKSASSDTPLFSSCNSKLFLFSYFTFLVITNRIA